MWPFATQKSVALPLSQKIQLFSLTKGRGVSSQVAVVLRKVEQRGDYAGRPVTYFRVFDPGNAKWGTSEVRRFDDLDVRRIVHSGHIESDGAIVLNRDSGQT
jgi:hypothetical protein